MNTLKLTEAKPVRLFAIGLLLALLSACGSEVTPRTTALFSTSGPTTSTLVSSGVVNTQCSYFDSTSTRLSGKVTTYYQNNVMQEDKARVRITSLVSDFDTNSNYYIQAFRWKIDTNGSVFIDQTPVQFDIESGGGSDTKIATSVSSISLTGISAYRNANAISGTGAVDFFSKTTLVMKAVDYNWQALKLVVYDGSVSPSKVVGQSDFLLPMFQANPNQYALTHSAILAPLHPFYSQRTLVLSESEWGSRGASYCF
jgi:hypothetical protein